MATPARYADLVRDESGSFRGRVRGAWPRDNAFDLLAFYRHQGNRVHLLPFSEIPHPEATYHVERVVRPTQGKTGRWKVGFTERIAKDKSESHYQIELDPGQRWWITRVVGEKKGDWRFETNTEYERLGDALMPVALHTRHVTTQREVTAHWQIRPMSQAERQELKQRVERAAQSEPTGPYRWLRCFLLAIVIACPLGGAMLLGITRRCELPQERS